MNVEDINKLAEYPQLKACVAELEAGIRRMVDHHQLFADEALVHAKANSSGDLRQAVYMAHHHRDSLFAAKCRELLRAAPSVSDAVALLEDCEKDAQRMAREERPSEAQSFFNHRPGCDCIHCMQPALRSNDASSSSSSFDAVLWLEDEVRYSLDEGVRSAESVLDSLIRRMKVARERRSNEAVTPSVSNEPGCWLGGHEFERVCGYGVKGCSRQHAPSASADHRAIGAGGGDEDGYVHPDVLATQSPEFQAAYAQRVTCGHAVEAQHRGPDDWRCGACPSEASTDDAREDCLSLVHDAVNWTDGPISNEQFLSLRRSLTASGFNVAPQPRRNALRSNEASPSVSEGSFTSLLDEPCQRCGAASGEPCIKAPSGDEAPYVHDARITLTRWAEEDRQRDRMDAALDGLRNVEKRPNQVLSRSVCEVICDVACPECGRAKEQCICSTGKGWVRCSCGGGLGHKLGCPGLVAEAPDQFSNEPSSSVSEDPLDVNVEGHLRHLETGEGEMWPNASSSELTEEKRKNADMHSTLALVHGFNEMATKAITLGEKAYYRLARDAAEKRFNALGGQIRRVDEHSTLLVIPGHVPEIRFDDRDIALMRDCVARFGGEAERVPWCEEHASSKAGVFARCLACACRDLHTALSLIDSEITGEHEVAPYDVDGEPMRVVARVKTKMDVLRSSEGIPS